MYHVSVFLPMFQSPGKWIDAIVALSSCLGGKEIAPTLVILRRKTSEDKKRRFDRYETMWRRETVPDEPYCRVSTLKLGRASSTRRHEINTSAPSVSFCTSKFALLTSRVDVKGTTDLLKKHAGFTCNCEHEYRIWGRVGGRTPEMVGV